MEETKQTSIIIVENISLRRAVYALFLPGGYVHGRRSEKPGDMEALGQEIYELNNKAYNATHGTRRRVPIFKHGPVDPTTPSIQLYKSLTYVIHHCDTDKTRFLYLFRDLQGCRRRTAEWIVDNSREYENCSWE